MKKELADILRYLEEVNTFALPAYKELPGVPLYMEQVLNYINDLLNSLTPQAAKPLTSFMVNNYVKARMIDEPAKKKYSKDQIGYLIAITLMKTAVSMSDMATLLELDQGISTNKEKIYRFWSEMEISFLGDTSRKTLSRVEAIQKKYDEEQESDPQKAEEDARNSLGFIALRLAIQAQASKLLSDYILATLDKNMHGDRRKKPGKKEIRHQSKQSGKEAKRVGKAARKPRNKKKRKEDVK